MMHRRRVVGEILDESGPISDDRQEVLVAALEAEAAHQDRWWRRVFAALSATLAAALLYLSMRQLLRPNDMRHHALFAGAIPAWEVAVLELANGMSMAMTGASMLVPRERPSRTAGFLKAWRCPAALLLALAWCPAMWAVRRAGSTEHLWRYAWLPLGPLAYALLVACADSWLSSCMAMARELRLQMYSLKTA